MNMNIHKVFMNKYFWKPTVSNKYTNEYFFLYKNFE